MKSGTIFYNPFEPLSILLLKEMIRDDFKFLILQRFCWPGLPSGKSFMATAYKVLDEAQLHQSELLEKEGKLLNLESDLEKIEDLILGKEFMLFLNTIKDENWTNKIIRSYKSKIAGYIRSRTQIKGSDGVDIELKFKWGRLVAVLTSGTSQLEVPAYDLIK